MAHGSGVITTLHIFNVTDGSFPAAGVLLDSAGDIFGTTSAGGLNNDGTIFEIANGSSTLTTLVSFNGTNGSSPNGLVMDASGNLFTTALYGATYDLGAVVELPSGSASLPR